MKVEMEAENRVRKNINKLKNRICWLAARAGSTHLRGMMRAGTSSKVLYILVQWRFLIWAGTSVHCKGDNYTAAARALS